MYLKLGGVNGETRIVSCPSGACVVTGLAPGKHTVEVCNEKGAVIPTDVALEYAVVSPRDAASGLPTGKRQHKPVVIRKAAAGGNATNVIEVTEAGAQVSIRVPGGATPPSRAQDHNSSRSNKTAN